MEKKEKPIYKQTWFIICIIATTITLVSILLLMGIIFFEATKTMFNDTTPAEISNIEILETNPTSVKLTITAIEKESTVKKIEYSIDNENWNECKEISYDKQINKVATQIIDNLESEKEYTIYIKVTNFANLVTTNQINVTTTEKKEEDNNSENKDIPLEEDKTTNNVSLEENKNVSLENEIKKVLTIYEFNNIQRENDVVTLKLHKIQNAQYSIAEDIERVYIRYLAPIVYKDDSIENFIVKVKVIDNKNPDFYYIFGCSLERRIYSKYDWTKVLDTNLSNIFIKEGEIYAK